MSLRFLIIFFKEFFKRFKGLIILGLVSGVIFFFLIRLLLPRILVSTEKIGVSGKYEPANLPSDILTDLGSGLTIVDENGNVSPGLAASWDTADGGKTWNFYLQEGLSWHDGDSVDAQSITYEFTDAQIERPNEKTLVFKLDTPFSAFPVVVSKPVFKKGLLGTGLWKVKDVSLVGGYVNKLTVTDGKGKQKMYIFYPSEERLKLGFKLGEVNVIREITDPKPFEDWKTTKINKSESRKFFVAIFLNTEKGNLAEKSYRQALAYSISKDNFNGERALGPISPSSWAFNPQVKQYTKDTERVSELLEGSENNSIRLSTAANLLPTAEAIKKEWDEAGVKTEVQVVTGIPEDYEALLATVDIPADPDQYVLWHSTQTATNISRFKNARIDKLLEDGRTQINKEERKKIYLDFQRFLVEDVPAIFLYHPNFYTITRK